MKLYYSLLTCPGTPNPGYGIRMKFLVDNALSPVAAQGLKESGYDAIHVRVKDSFTKATKLSQHLFADKIIIQNKK